MLSRVLLLSFKALFLLIYFREEVLVSHSPQIHFNQLWLSFFAHQPLSVVLAVLTSWEKAALSLPAQACYSDNLTRGWRSAAEDSKGLGHLMGLDTLQSGWQICLFTESRGKSKEEFSLALPTWQNPNSWSCLKSVSQPPFPLYPTLKTAPSFILHRLNASILFRKTLLSAH